MSEGGIGELKLGEGDDVKVYNRKGTHTLLYPIKGGWMTVSHTQGRIEAVKNSDINLAVTRKLKEEEEG